MLQRSTLQNALIVKEMCSFLLSKDETRDAKQEITMREQWGHNVGKADSLRLKV